MRRDLIITSGLMLLMTMSFYPVYAQTVVLTVPPRNTYDAWLNLSSGEEVDYSFTVTSWRGVDVVDFAITDFAGSTIYLYAGRVGQYSGIFIAPSTGVYTFKFDNTFSIITTKYVALQYSVSLTQAMEPSSPISPQTVTLLESTSYSPPIVMLMLWATVIVVFFAGVTLAVYSLVMGRRRSSLRSPTSLPQEETSPELSTEETISSHQKLAVNRSPIEYVTAVLISIGVFMILYSVVVTLSDYLSSSMFRSGQGVWNWYLFFAGNPSLTMILQIGPMLVLFGAGLRILAPRGSSQSIGLLRPISARTDGHPRRLEAKEVLVEPVQLKNKICPHCGAEVPVDRIICGKCQMPA